MTMLSERQQLSYIAAQAADARLNVELETEGMTLNIGPQHPATHGTLRIIARLDGEQVVWAEPSAGYMHRGYEKLTEVRTFPQVTTLINRIDWLGSFANEVPFILALWGIGIGCSCWLIHIWHQGRWRVRFEEVTRSSAGSTVQDLFRSWDQSPFVDAIKISCQKCGAHAERVEDVGNPWLDAGIVPESQGGGGDAAAADLRRLADEPSGDEDHGEAP